MSSFEEIGINASLIKAIEELGFNIPTPIQEKVIPEFLANQQDLIGLAQTGTGKTAAFGLPLVQMADPKIKQTQSFILAPTRELCMQIASDIKNYAKYTPKLNVVPIYGGANMDRQIRAIKKGAHIIVATPGRMNDLLNKQKKIDLSTCQIVVLDEADEMLNMGFKEEIDAILDRTPEDKKTFLFSATMPKEVLQISKNYMHDPKKITIGVQGSGAENVDHFCYFVRSRERYLALKRIVDYNPAIYGIIFCRTRIETKEIAQKLIQDGYNADALHGDLSQEQRETVMNKFRIKNLQILVATDVAARGLDVKDITHVINYNLPDETEAYTHRSGRTGRAGKKGISIVIVNLKEKYKLKQIETKLRKKMEITTIPKGQDICEKQLLNLVDKMQNIEINHKEIDRFLPIIQEKLEFLTREELIKHFVSLEFNRFLDYYRDLRDIDTPQKERGRKDNARDNKNRSIDRTDVETGFTRFHINLGFKDGLSPRELIGLINRCTRKRKIDIGRISLMKTFSFFEVDEKHTLNILNGFKDVEFNRKDVIVQVKNDSESSKEKSTHQFKNKSRNRKPDRSRKPKKKKKSMQS
jgi:ATP-dependent RNA helicase DeaD